MVPYRSLKFLLWLGAQWPCSKNRQIPPFCLPYIEHKDNLKEFEAVYGAFSG